MKLHKSFAWLLLALLAGAFSLPANAQDDLYYDPSTDHTTTTTYDEQTGLTQSYRGDDYDDEFYQEDEDDYDYEYSSRIRRFHGSRIVYDYYDPFYTDLYFYDPFYSPGTSIYVVGYNDYWRWRRWNRWNRRGWNDWGWGNPYYSGYNNWCGWNSWGYSSYGGWGSWNNTYVYNNYYYDPYWTVNGYNPYYCPSNVWVNNNYYYNNSNGHHNGGYAGKTYTGTRRHGTSINPGYVRAPGNNGRLAVAENKPGDHERIGGKPNGRTIVSDKEPAASTERMGRAPSAAQPGSTLETRQPEATGRAPRTETVPMTEPRRRTESATEPTRRLPESEPVRPSRSIEPTRRSEPATEPVRPSRRMDESQPARPNRSIEPTRRSEPSTEPRPSRRSMDVPQPSENRSPRTLDSGRSNDRPSRSNAETRPSRSESSNSRSFDSGRSSTPSSSGSSGRSSGGSSSGGGGKRGRD